VSKFLATIKEYLPSQRPSSFSIDQIVEKMQRDFEAAPGSMLAQEGVDLVLKVAVASGDRTLKLLGLFVSIGRFINLADAEARSGRRNRPGF
jgi:hypothetical protein